MLEKCWISPKKIRRGIEKKNKIKGGEERLHSFGATCCHIIKSPAVLQFKRFSTSVIYERKKSFLDMFKEKIAGYYLLKTVLCNVRKTQRYKCDRKGDTFKQKASFDLILLYFGVMLHQERELYARRCQKSVDVSYQPEPSSQESVCLDKEHVRRARSSLVLLNINPLSGDKQRSVLLPGNDSNLYHIMTRAQLCRGCPELIIKTFLCFTIGIVFLVFKSPGTPSD